MESNFQSCQYTEEREEAGPAAIVDAQQVAHEIGRSSNDDQEAEEEAHPDCDAWSTAATDGGS